ncbi:hypothetical protein CQA57_02875 [Helicobacter anseris]|uniref:Outer membrane beta-barrel protein n=1 Tax=Helicobacter anseris TaxID=375926 RepID=A0A3D8JAY1_9HELI|nr:hypothetical protein [Helicobacter anseris]RDU74226.1 hypothetical protein CQA57_02875 [Helicobacter anseris]
MNKKIFLAFLNCLFVVCILNAEDTKKDVVGEIVKDVAIDKGGKELDKLVDNAKESAKKDIDLKENKNGFILGTGITLLELNSSQIIAGFEKLVSTTPSLDAGLILGYQGYFSEMIGLRFNVMVETGARPRIKAIKLQPAIKTGTSSGGTSTANTTQSALIQDLNQTYIPLKASAELSFLLDFYTAQKHSVGMDVGVGYEIEWYIVQNAGASYSSSGNISGLQKLTQKPQNILNSTVYPLIGLHYYYKKHQFGITYKFGEYFFVKNGYKPWGFNIGGGNSIEANTRFFTTQSVRLSYIYRF